MKKPGKWVQCSSLLRTRSGGVFCIRSRGHDGDHRGDRAQWNDRGRVPITLNQDGSPKNARTRASRPSWTVHYNRVVPGSRWIGTGWEFFDDEASATRRYDELIAEGNCPTRRPYYTTDKEHLGAVHAMNGEG